jgi:hypothetical protein
MHLGCGRIGSSADCADRAEADLYLAIISNDTSMNFELCKPAPRRWNRKPGEQLRSPMAWEHRAMNRKRSWTEEDKERLKAFVANDVSIIRVAAAFKRSIPNLRSQARKLGTPFPRMSAFRKKFNDASVNEERRF